ncbi:sodium:solute symporter [Roseivirga sp. BDSF3-8]|uniref:sodium:solute symporter n=1 Tax=Roseivirga sp. BDSF3-8 TaxID=3241598 RepID=UPI003532788D
MSTLDWFVLFGTLLFIVSYGVWKTRGSHNIEGYLLGDKSMPWWTIGLSIMATQASAITFLSTPGQAYQDGMRFVQFYFGLPLAMIILSVFVVPIYYRLRVYTAYEYLENRFDLKTRTLAAFLFLVQRGLAAGITIYAPAIILSTILGWPLGYTNLIIGVLVIIYTVSGGTKAVSQTQKQQMAVMMGGMLIAFIVILNLLPEKVGFTEALSVAGSMDRMNVVSFDMEFDDRYNIWSGLLGGFFLAMSYFGTDQSQVQRYLGGKSVKESRLGLIFNGLLKVPMQFFILLIGLMVFVFYQYEKPPVFFNQAALEEVSGSSYADSLQVLNRQFDENFAEKRALLDEFAVAGEEESGRIREQLVQKMETQENIRSQVGKLVEGLDKDLEGKDTDYIFIHFVTNYLPKGLVGLLLAVIFSAAMSSTAGELNALGSTTTVDLYKRSIKKNGSDKHYLIMSKVLTFLWGCIAIGVAMVASLFENLIQAVNLLGSLFYGTILGIFLAGFFIKHIKGNAIFVAAIIGEAVVFGFYFFSEIGFLWYNLIGCGTVILAALILQMTGNQVKN